MGKTSLHGIHVKETLAVFWRASYRHKWHVILGFTQPLGAIILSVALPFYASTILARLAQQNPDTAFPLIMLAVCVVVGILCNLLGFQSVMRLQALVLSELNQRVFGRLLARSVGFHADRVSGKIVSDAIDFANAYATLSTSIMLNGSSLAASLLVGLVVVVINSWQLGIFVVAVVATTLIWAALESRTRSEMRAKRLVASKKMLSHLSDSIVNAPTVKTFAQEATETQRNAKLNHSLMALRINDWGRAGISGTKRVGFLLVMQFLLILYVMYLTRQNPGVLAAGIFAFTYTFTLTNRLFEINNLTRVTEEAFMQASPMIEMLREPVETSDKPNAQALQVTHGEIALTNVDFTYHQAGQNGAVFQDFSLVIKPGERVGLVGPSGGGKSTFTRLLLRFDELSGGAITIDGQDISEVTQQSLREAIAYVPQEPLLFHRTIRENIAYSRPDATDTQIIAAAKKANAHDFITGLSDDYNTIVGERGVKLSGGQRQRIAIARAMLKNAPILILDEATSALDSESEVFIQAALWELMKDRTAIVIAHRLSTIQKMDRIIVLDNGSIAEQGSHKQLLKNNGIYARLWKHQSGGFIEE